MTDTAVIAPAPGSRDQVRRYGPLAALVAAVVLAITGLPSALNLPQTNPTQTLEYAPVPPDQNSQNAPAGGNFSGLGLGSTVTGPGAATGPGGQASAAPSAEAGLPSQPGGSGGTGNHPPSKYRCVAGHQTEDPLSPTCVAIYQGDNGGSTYRGVTATDITVVYYFACVANNKNDNTFPTSQGTESETCGEVDDIDKPPATSDFILTRALKRLSAYFNARYQTYNRHVHMYAAYGSPGDPTNGCTDACRQGDASTELNTYKPFAVLTQSNQGAPSLDPYVDAMAQKGVLAFGGDQHHASFYAAYPGLIWSYLPSIEEQAQIYGSLLCQEVANRTETFSGNAADAGRTRKLGMLYFDKTDEFPYYTELKNLLESQLAGCGASIAVEHGYHGLGAVSGGPGYEPAETEDMQDFQSKGVTTVIWNGPANGDFTRDGNQLGYTPEWLVMGDGGMEDFIVGRYSTQTSWKNAYAVTTMPLEGTESSKLCAQATREADPSFPSTDLPYACNMYDDLRQMFTGIQVAGPHLSPTSMNQGFRAIPPHTSSSPQVPACFYLQDDYTCVKDAEILWWDTSGAVPGWTGNGCYRAQAGGKRFIAGQWPNEDVKARTNASTDPCDGYGGAAAGGPWTPTQ